MEFAQDSLEALAEFLGTSGENIQEMRVYETLLLAIDQALATDLSVPLLATAQGGEPLPLGDLVTSVFNSRYLDSDYLSEEATGIAKVSKYI